MPPIRRHVYILGLWLQPNQRPGQPPVWRIVLEDAYSAERSGFTALAELEAFLAARMSEEKAEDGE